VAANFEPLRSQNNSENLYKEMVLKVGRCCTQEPNPVFKTPRPLGSFRNEFVIEINSFNCRPFNGTVTPTEASLVIYEQILNLKQRDMEGSQLFKKIKVSNKQNKASI
jgi:hypothetical protein